MKTQIHLFPERWQVPQRYTDYPRICNSVSNKKKKKTGPEDEYSLFVFSSGWEERGLHAAVQRGLLCGAEGALSLRARPAVSLMGPHGTHTAKTAC